MQVRMLFFAHLQDVTGSHELQFSLPENATVRTAAAALEERFEALESLLDHVRVAVNAEFAGPETVLHEADEVAWMPPMSGGMTELISAAAPSRLTRAPIDGTALSRSVEAPDYGAIVTFAGHVRDNARGQQVLYLEYEAYLSLAEKQLAHLIGEAEKRWEVKCAVQHRLGRLEIGECSVFVAAASPHRGEAFDACRWLLDTLKETVPIWKREAFEGGAHWVEGSDIVGIDPPPLPDYWQGTGLI